MVYCSWLLQTRLSSWVYLPNSSFSNIMSLKSATIRSLYTMEFGNCYKWGIFFSESLLLNIYQHSTDFTSKTSGLPIHMSTNYLMLSWNTPGAYILGNEKRWYISKHRNKQDKVCGNVWRKLNERADRLNKLFLSFLVFSYDIRNNSPSFIKV